MSNVRLFSCFMRLFLFQSSRKCKKFFPRNFSAKYYEIDNYKNTTSSLKKIDEEHAKVSFFFCESRKILYFPTFFHIHFTLLLFNSGFWLTLDHL